MDGLRECETHLAVELDLSCLEYGPKPERYVELGLEEKKGGLEPGFKSIGETGNPSMVSYLPKGRHQAVKNKKGGLLKWIDIGGGPRYIPLALGGVLRGRIGIFEVSPTLSVVFVRCWRADKQ